MLVVLNNRGYLNNNNSVVGVIVRKSLSKQHGLSSLGWLVVLSIAGFLLLITFKLAPVYLEDRFVVGAMESLANDPELAQLTKGEINRKLSSAFAVNNVRGQARNSVDVKKSNKKTIVSIRYEERIPILLNADVVLSFHHELDTNNPAKCCTPATPKTVSK